MIIYFLNLFLPPIGLLIFAVVGLFLHRRKVGLSLLAVSLFLLLILSLPAVANTIARYWESIPVIQTDDIRRFSPQAIVVIGGGLERAASEYQSESTVNTRTLVRLRYAAKLARETELPVMVSGGQPTTDPTDVSEAKVMAAVLREEFNIPVDWEESASLNTAENARFSRDILIQSGIDRIILVTQAYHMPRAESEFLKAGFKVLPAPTAFIGRTAVFSLFDWIPSVNALDHVFLLTHESVGMLWYRFRY